MTPWRVKNVPSDAELRVQVLYRDDGAKGDYVGKFMANANPGAKEQIKGPGFKRDKGTSRLEVRVVIPTRLPLC